MVICMKFSVDRWRVFGLEFTKYRLRPWDFALMKFRGRKKGWEGDHFNLGELEDRRAVQRKSWPYTVYNAKEANYDKVNFLPNAL